MYLMIFQKGRVKKYLNHNLLYNKIIRPKNSIRHGPTETSKSYSRTISKVMSLIEVPNVIMTILTQSESIERLLQKQVSHKSNY